MLLTVVLEKTLESLGLQGDPTSASWRKSVLNILWKDWCWSWSSNTLATSCEELSHWKRPWCWERLKVGGEGDNRGWGGWMASLTRWMWVWVSSRSSWLIGKPSELQSIGSQKVGQDWATELNAGVTGLIPRLRRAPGEGNGNSLQYSCQENYMDRGAWLSMRSQRCWTQLCN